MFGDPTIGDAILDRVVHRAHRIELKGPSLRKRNAVGAPAAGDSASAGRRPAGPPLQLRYITKVIPCQEAVNPRESARSATPSGRPSIAPDMEVTNPPPWSATADRRTRPQRWRDAVAELLALQAAYTAWCDALPDGLRNTQTAEALQAIADLDLDALATIEPPRGYGRD